MAADSDPRVASRDSSAAAGGRSVRPPWLLVVARGHPRLLAELEAIFHGDPRVRVIEDRRRGQALLPRAESVRRAELPVG